MTSFRTLAPALAGALVLSFGFAAVGFAQDAGAPAPTSGADGGHHMDRAAMKQHREEMRAQHAKILHDALNIRSDQEGAFQTYQASLGGMHGHGGHRGEHKAKGDHHPMTTPERLDMAQKRMGERQAQFEQVAAATKTFYAVLNPEQQRTFDALGASHRHRGGHRGMGRGRHETSQEG